MRLAVLLLASLSGVLAQLRDDVTDCGAYALRGQSRDCINQGQGCVESGWFSKISKTPVALQRVDANKACMEAGFPQGADTQNFGGNWGHTCRFPGMNGTPNRAGGTLGHLGYTVTWKCAGKRGTGTNAPEPISHCKELDSRVVSCKNWSGVCGGAGCRVAQGWFSSITHDRKNAVDVCKKQGYSGAITKYGGNWGQQCRHPGNSKSLHNKAGGNLDQFGYTVTWFCDGPRVCKGGESPMPTMSPTTGCYDLDDRVVHCDGYKGSCSGAGCVREKGWFSKITRDRLNAVEVCRSQGFSGEISQEYGGNWGQQCRYPGTTKGNPNRAGGELKQFGYTVTWRCLGEQQCNGETVPTMPPTSPTLKPTTDKKVCPLREDIVDCGKHDGESCKSRGVGCVGRRWFSKVSREGDLQRVDAVQVCKEQGYSGEILQYGGNWGYQCRHPGNDRQSTNRAGGELNSFGYTVAWRCEGTQQGCGAHKLEPTPEPTQTPTSPGNMPDHVTDCGRGWFSKVRDPRVNAKQICRDMGYNGGVGDWGGNWGNLCRYPGTGTLQNGGTPNNAGGPLENLGTNVSWQCMDLPDTIPDHIHSCGNDWFSMVKGTTVNPTEICKDMGYTGEVQDWGVHDDTLCDEAEDLDGGDDTGLSGSVSWRCTDIYDRPEHIVHCGKYNGEDCKNQGLGCVGKGWFSKTTSPRVDAEEVCRGEGYEGVDEMEYGGNWGNQCRYPGTERGQGNKAGGMLTNFGMTVTWKCVGGSTPTPTRAGGDKDCALVFLEDVPKKYTKDSYMQAAKDAKCEADCTLLQGKWKKKKCLVKASKKGPKIRCKNWEDMVAEGDEIAEAICAASGCKLKSGKKCDGKPKNLQK